MGPNQHDDRTPAVEWAQCAECGLVAEVVDRDTWPSTDGPVEHVHVRCVVGHRFVMPAAALETSGAGNDDVVTPGRELVHRDPAEQDLVRVRVRRRDDERPDHDG